MDAVIEDCGRLLALEIKTSARPTRDHARHLRAFREEYGDDVAGCLLLHNGDATFRVEAGIVATPWWRVATRRMVIEVERIYSAPCLELCGCAMVAWW